MKMEFLDGYNALHNRRTLENTPVVLMFLTNCPDCMGQIAIRSGSVGDVKIIFKLPKKTLRRRITDIHSKVRNIEMPYGGQW